MDFVFDKEFPITETTAVRLTAPDVRTPAEWVSTTNNYTLLVKRDDSIKVVPFDDYDHDSAQYSESAYNAILYAPDEQSKHAWLEVWVASAVTDLEIIALLYWPFPLPIEKVQCIEIKGKWYYYARSTSNIYNALILINGSCADMDLDGNIYFTPSPSVTYAPAGALPEFNIIAQEPLPLPTISAQLMYNFNGLTLFAYNSDVRDPFILPINYGWGVPSPIESHIE